jgi:hypothetical protein
MSQFAKYENEQMRLTILQMLEQDRDFTANDTVVNRALDSVGFSVSSDKLKTELAWLQEQGVIELNESMSMTIVKLTQRGQDVALGRATIPGIPRPRPKG